MPSRSQSVIRRDINRLEETMARHEEGNSSLGVLLPVVHAAAEKVNTTWQQFQAASIAGNKERKERDATIGQVVGWTKRWRPVTLLLVSGAPENLHKLPSHGTTPDQSIRIAEDLAAFIRTDKAAAGFREQALAELGTLLEDARKETREAVAAMPAEARARQNYAQACREANTVLIRGLEVIRAIFGRKSPEYKQFIARHSVSEGKKSDTAGGMQGENGAKKESVTVHHPRRGG
jgi:hypothetical protein